MNALAILSMAAGRPAAEILNFLERLKILAPDMAAEIDFWLVALQTPLGAENLAAIAKVLPGEIVNIFKGQIDPRDHPSDGI
jgi:hypothetical protein